MDFHGQNQNLFRQWEKCGIADKLNAFARESVFNPRRNELFHHRNMAINISRIQVDCCALPESSQLSATCPS